MQPSSLVSARAIGALACGGGEMPNTMRDGSVTARLLHAVPDGGLAPSPASQRGASHTGNPCLALRGRCEAPRAPSPLGRAPGSIMACLACLACLIVAHKTGCCMLRAVLQAGLR